MPAGQTGTTMEQRLETGGGDEPLTAAPAPAPEVMVPRLDGALGGVWPPAGLGLIGDGAHDAARGFLVSALADIRDIEPDARPHLVIPSETLTTLLGTGLGPLGESPRVHVTAGLREALILLDEITLTRARMLHDTNTGDITQLRDHDSYPDPVPPILLIAGATTETDHTRVAAVLTQGKRLDIHGVVLGPWPHGDTVTVANDGTTHGADNVTGIHTYLDRMTVLGPAQAADLLRTVIEADTGKHPPRIGPVTSQPAGSPATSGRPSRSSDPSQLNEPPPPTDDVHAIDRPAVDGHDATEPAPGQADTVERAGEDPEPSDPSDGGPATSSTPPDATERTVVSITVFGPGRPDIVGLPADSKEKPPLRLKAREILAYLMAHPRGVTEDALYDDVLADLRASGAPAMLNTYVYNLRRNLRATAGPGEYLLRGKSPARCDLETVRFDCDLWRFHEHLRIAEHAAGAAQQIEALRAAVETYTGPFADGQAYEWAEPVREAIRRQAIDAHSGLAELLSPTDPTAAITCLNNAITIDPYNETLYQHAMRVHAAVGDIDSIRRIRRQLTIALARIPAEPGDDTLALADRLISDSKRPHRGSP
jgi:DNA-binding SARP family transcriptional activator